MDSCVTNEQMARAFNEWMRRFVDDPDRFEHEFKTIGEYLKEANNGGVPSYGEQSTAYMEKLINEMAS